jgi:murein DD-endopeptidase MepM/ murein hydrolase activator NlpD
MEISVELGDIVYQGQLIAKVGDVGSFEGPKLNFQIWKDGKNLSPEVWLKKRTISAVVK